MADDLQTDAYAGPEPSRMTLAEAVWRYPHLDWPQIVRDWVGTPGADEPQPVEGWRG